MASGRLDNGVIPPSDGGSVMTASAVAMVTSFRSRQDRIPTG